MNPIIYPLPSQAAVVKWKKPFDLIKN